MLKRRLSSSRMLAEIKINAIRTWLDFTAGLPGQDRVFVPAIEKVEWGTELRPHPLEMGGARVLRSILAFFPKNFYAFSKNPIRDLKSRRNETMNRFLEGNKVIYVLGGVGFRLESVRIRWLQLVIKNFTTRWGKIGVFLRDKI